MENSETDSPGRQRILVADDVEAVTTLLVTALEIAGYEVVVAENGQKAYELGKSGEFDLAVIDQLMPGLLGTEILGRWQSEGVSMPVIMLSGVEDDEVVVGSLDSGAIDYVHKPFRLPELMARIRKNLN